MAVMVVFLTACEKQSTIKLPGYVEGKLRYIASPLSGILKTLNHSSGDLVKENETLYSLDPHPEQEELHSAEARLNQVHANELKAESEYKLQQLIYNRQNGLYQKHVISREAMDLVSARFDQAKAAFLSAGANVNEILSQLHKSKWVMEQKNIRSPVAGQVFDVYYRTGELVPMNSPVVSLLTPSDIKVIFYAPEADLARIKLHQRIGVDCDQCKTPINAHITFISPRAEFTPPVIYSAEVRKKLTYRIEALLEATNGVEPLHPGQPVTVTVLLDLN